MGPAGAFRAGTPRSGPEGGVEREPPPRALRSDGVAAPYSIVLCAVDLSPTSEVIVRVACGLTAAGGVVHLLHVDEPAAVLDPIAASGGSETKARELEASHARAAARLRRLGPVEAGDAGVRAEPTVVSGQGVVARVLEEATRVGAEAIVVGTHGRTGVGRIVMGSVAADLAKRSPLPVILVRDRPRVAR